MRQNPESYDCGNLEKAAHERKRPCNRAQVETGFYWGKENRKTEEGREGPTSGKMCGRRGEKERWAGPFTGDRSESAQEMLLEATAEGVYPKVRPVQMLTKTLHIVP